MPRTNFCKPNPTVEDKYYNSQNTYEDADGFIKNKYFIQIFDNSNDYLLQLMEKDTTAAEIFLFLARYAENNNTIDIAEKELCQIFNKSDKTIRRAIKKLKDCNFLTIIKDGKRNIYFLNPQVTSNTKGRFKSKLVTNYVNIATTSQINMEIDENVINKRALEEYTKRERITYKFKLKNKNFQDETTEEMIKKLEDVSKLNTDIEELQRQKQQLLNEINQAKNEKENTIKNDGLTFEDLAENLEGFETLTEDDFF